MKIVVISEETRQRILTEDPMLDAIDSSKTKKEKELEKKEKNEIIDNEKKKKDNDDAIKTPPKDDKTTTPPKDDKTTTPPKDDKTTTPPKDDKTNTPPKDDKTTTPPKDDKTNTPPKDDKTTTPPKDNKTTTPPIVTDTDLTKTPTDPPKPTNPSGKVIPKPKKPLMKNSPAAKAGIPTETRQKFANMNAAFQATKRKDSGYTKMDFIKDFPNSQTAKKFNKGERIPGFKYPKKTKKVKAEPPVNLKDMSSVSKPKEVTIDDFKSTPAPKKEEIKSSYEPYHIVLGYLLHEGHADTINEAHYVMTQMDEKTIKEIVALDEGLGGKVASVAALTLGGLGLDAIRKQMQNKKKMDQGGKFKPGSMMDNIQKRNEMLKNM